MKPERVLELGLKIGDAILVKPRLGSASKRYGAHFIGALPGQSLLVSMPADTAGIYQAKEGEALTLRAFDGDRAIAFNCTVLRNCVHPYHYLHLSYPQQLEQVVVRRYRRLNIERDSLLVREPPASPLPVRLVNLSITGALLVGPVGVLLPGMPVRLETTLAFEGLDDQPLTLSATVRNIKDDGEGADASTLYGIEFHDLEPTTVLTLRAFVFERLYSSATR